MDFLPAGKKVPSGFGRLRPVVSKLKQEPFIKRTSIMNTDRKQAMHVEAGKSFGTAEANENERRWNDDKIGRKNQDPTNHYDKSRMGLNFEIGPDGKIHPLGYQQKSLEVRLMDRLAELGWHPFKADSKIQPNCCAKFIFGGNHDRTLEMAFGDQTVNPDKGEGRTTATSGGVRKSSDGQKTSMTGAPYDTGRRTSSASMFISMRAVRISMP